MQSYTHASNSSWSGSVHGLPTIPAHKQSITKAWYALPLGGLEAPQKSPDSNTVLLSRSASHAIFGDHYLLLMIATALRMSS